MMSKRKYGILFVMYDIWLIFLVINEFLEMSNKDIYILREMEKNKK